MEKQTEKPKTAKAHKTLGFRMVLDVFMATLEARRKWNNAFKILKEDDF